MPPYDITKEWDSTASKIYAGPGNGTELGFTGEVSIEIQEDQHEVTSAQTGSQPLDLRRQSEVYLVSVDFKEIGQADYFTEWWFKGINAGDLHPGTLGGSVPGHRVRFHPTALPDNVNTHDFLFEELKRISGPKAVFNGRGEHVHRITFKSFPVPGNLPVVDLGQFGYTPV